jgi:hypothetical protein
MRMADKQQKMVDGRHHIIIIEFLDSIRHKSIFQDELILDK